MTGGLRIQGATHLPGATPEQRTRLRDVLEQCRLPVADAVPPAAGTGKRCVSFFVEDEEIPEVIELANRCGVSKATASRIAWRIGTYFMLWYDAKMR